MENTKFLAKTLALLIVILIGIFFLSQNLNIQAPETTTDIDWNAYQEQENISFYEFEGTLALEGYTDIETSACTFQDIEECSVNYTFFVANKANHPAFFDWLEQMKGNSFIRENAIGLGCYQQEKERIYSINNADVEETESTITGKDLKKLLDSSKSNPIIIEVERLKLTAGRGAPDCYSHFRNFKVF